MAGIEITIRCTWMRRGFPEQECDERVFTGQSDDGSYSGLREQYQTLMAIAHEHGFEYVNNHVCCRHCAPVARRAEEVMKRLHPTTGPEFRERDDRVDAFRTFPGGVNARDQFVTRELEKVLLQHQELEGMSPRGLSSDAPPRRQTVGPFMDKDDI